MEEVAFKPLTGGYDASIYTPSSIKYFPTFCEYAAENYAKVSIVKARAAAGTTTLYTVPAGYIFYMTNASVSLVAAAATAVVEIINNLTAEDFVMTCAAANNCNSQTYDFTMPIRCPPGSVIDLSMGVGAYCYGQIIGFLVKFT